MHQSHRSPVNRRSVLKGTLGASLLTAGLSQTALARQEASPQVSEESRTVAAANGDVTITGTPQRVVVMEYELTENLVALGVEPVGVCEPESVNNWVPLPEPLADSIVDVGTRDEPDIEAIIGLEPDLILAASPRQDAMLANLESIAPTVQLETYSPMSAPEGLTPIEHFKHILTQVAVATNRQAEAETAIAEFDALLEAGTAAVAQTEFAGRPFVYAGVSEFTSVNLFNEHSRIAHTIGQLGLINQAGENSETPGLHYQTLSIEELGTLPEDTLFFVALSPQITEEATELFEGELWQGMPWVQAGGFINLGEPNVWTAGSAITLSNLIERVTESLGAPLDS